MYYSPHTLYKRMDSSPTFDEKGNPVFNEGDYKEIGVCRCDDSNIQEMADEKGHVFRPSYKIVTEKPKDISCGDYIKVMDKDGARGEGKVKNISKCNYFSYVVLWV